MNNTCRERGRSPKQYYNVCYNKYNVVKNKHLFRPLYSLKCNTHNTVDSFINHNF